MSGSYSIHNLKTGYRSGHKQIVVSDIKEVSLSEGEMVCLLGPNGAGKSTLLRTLTGFQPPLEGDIKLMGKSISEYTSKELAKKVSIVLTDNSHIRNLTVYEVVAMGRSPYNGFWGRLNEHDKEVVSKCLEWIKIEHLSDRKIDTLSDGEKQKVMLAKAIAQETPVILLDEPTSFLYYPDKVHIMELLRHLAHEMNKTILFSTHAIEIALQTADQIWFLDGKDLITGTPEELCGERIKSLSFENILDCIDMIQKRRS